MLQKTTSGELKRQNPPIPSEPDPPKGTEPMEAKPNNILPLDELSKKVNTLKSSGQTVVMCHGVFDLVHIGHIRHFEQAKALGDILVVTLTPDRFVNKGTHRPAFPEDLRAEAVAALKMVDYVAINPWPTAEKTIPTIRPDIFCKGGEYRQQQVDSESTLQPELAAARQAGTRVEFTDDIVFSSSNLINRHFSPFPESTNNWLDNFRTRHSAESIIDLLDTLKSSKVLVVGDAILDEYVFTTAIGKSTKDPVLACQYHDTETFVGGSLAIANHLAGFCDHVGLITCLGNTERREEFIKKSLLPQVRPTFITNHQAPTIHKRRFVDAYSQNKLLELYVMNDQPLMGNDEANLLETLETQLSEYDVVIVADYGHGMLTPPAITSLCENAKFLAVNTQSNAGNRGFNPVSKYKRADYVCLARHELELETRLRRANPNELLLEMARNIACPHFTVTQGKEGSLHYDENNGFTHVPAFATAVSDRVGAGDAVLALTSLLVAHKIPWEVVGFVGNVSGAQLVGELGNRYPISQVPMAKHIISLLK